MRRTCERPGCAEPATVAFGMVPEDLVVWLEACDPATLAEPRPGLLCRRHADAMVVPVGWTLDDHREPVPRLFKVREDPAPPRAAGDHTGRTRRPRLEQASLLDTLDEGTPTGTAEVVTPSAEAVQPDAAPVPGPAEPAWSPQFDRSDDLDGLLAPRGRLLRRAFGTDPRP